MNRLEELAGVATHVAEQSWGVSDATQTAMREIAAILLAASKVDVAGLTELAWRYGTNREPAEKFETALRMALAVREPKGE